MTVDVQLLQHHVPLQLQHVAVAKLTHVAVVAFVVSWIASAELDADHVAAKPLVVALLLLHQLLVQLLLQHHVVDAVKSLTLVDAVAEKSVASFHELATSEATSEITVVAKLQLILVDATLADESVVPFHEFATSVETAVATAEWLLTLALAEAEFAESSHVLKVLAAVPQLVTTDAQTSFLC